MAEHNSFDVVISGGGLVGLTLGLALARGGIEVAVVDAQKPEAVTAPKFDGRASAIALASCRMLKALGLWPDLEAHAQPIKDILVTDGSLRRGASPLFLHFDHRELGDEPLGSMIENRHIRIALHKAAAQTPGLTLIIPALLGVPRTNP